MKILITGSRSGLGKFIFDRLGGIAWNRDISDRDKKKLKLEGVDIIIHCAFNSTHSVDSKNLYDYFSDNVLLTAELLEIPHKKFIFTSTLDVYPKDHKYHKENEIIDINAIDGIYGITKLISEALVIKKSSRFLILRCSAMLGKDSRKNTLIRIIEGAKELNLSGQSIFNHILHTDVLDFINFAIKNDFLGIYNVASSGNITLQEVADISKKQVNFGDLVYNVSKIDNSKISSIFPAFKKTSKEVIKEFLSSEGIYKS